MSASRVGTVFDFNPAKSLPLRFLLLRRLLRVLLRKKGLFLLLDLQGGGK